MEVDEEPQSNVHNIFGYRKIVWKIVNYFPGTCGKDWIIRSPEFSVYSPILTRWRLFLKLTPRLDFYSVSTYLERLKCGPFKDELKVIWKFSYTIDDDPEIMKPYLETFKTDFEFGTKIPDIVPLERKVFDENGNFVVQCHMIVYAEEDCKIVETCKDSGLKSLSQDLSVLNVVERNTDTKLFTGSVDTINVHRAIVGCRNRVFKNLIGNDRVADLNCPRKILDGVCKIVRFLYTADLKYILRLPSFAVKTAIEHFDVQELKEYYSYHELTMETKISTTEIQFKWMASDVDKITEGHILSHNMRSLSNNENFRLALYPKGIDGKRDHMEVQIRFSDASKPRPLCVVLGVFDIYKKVQNLICKRWYPSMGENMIFEDFVSRDVLENPLIVTKGRLTLFCRLQKSTGVTREPVSEAYPVIKIVDKRKHYIKLSQDVASLLETGEFSDTTVESGVLRIRVHKMILTCRSYVMAKMIGPDTTYISFPEIEPRILIVIFQYMYCGVLRECTTWEILHLYDAAKRYSILALINTCFHLLRNSLDVGNAVDILSVANKNDDSQLKFFAFKFICCNFAEIQTQECWQRLENEQPSLFTQWTQFLNAQGPRLLG